MKLPKVLNWMAIAGLAWGAGFIFNTRLGGEPYWVGELYRNKMAIAASISAPKLIITGGSGAHYTVNSETLSDELNRPVVNLGLDGPIGLDVILPSVLEAIKPGDTVLLVPEYLLLESDDGLGEKSAWFGIVTNQIGVGEVPAKQMALSTLQLGIPSLKWAVKSTTDLTEEGRFAGYYDGPLTENGDPIETKLRTGEWWPLEIAKPVSAHIVRRIATFKGEVEDRGGELILSIPWVYGDVNDARTLESVQKTVDDLSAIAPLLVDDKTLNVQDSPALFADTHYHLIPEGRELRSQQLARQLKPLLLDSP